RNSRNRRGLAIPPTMTARVTPACFSAWISASSWPACTQVIASTTSLSASAVSPRCATATTATPRRRAVSAKSTGKRPLPAMSPTRSIVLPADAARRVGDEGEEPLDLGYVTEASAHLLYPFAARARSMKQHAVRPAEHLDDARRHAAAAQADRVQAEQPRPIARHDTERRHVLRHHRPGRRPGRFTQADGP